MRDWWSATRLDSQASARSLYQQDEVLARGGQGIPAQTEAARRQLQRHVLLLHQLQPMASPEVQEALAADVFLARHLALQAVLLGQLGVDPEALFQDEGAQCRLVHLGRRRQHQLPATLDGDLHRLAARAALEGEAQVIHLEAWRLHGRPHQGMCASCRCATAPRGGAQHARSGPALAAHTCTSLSWLARACSISLSASTPALSASTSGGRSRIRCSNNCPFRLS